MCIATAATSGCCSCCLTHPPWSVCSITGVCLWLLGVARVCCRTVQGILQQLCDVCDNLHSLPTWWLQLPVEITGSTREQL